MKVLRQSFGDGLSRSTMLFRELGKESLGGVRPRNPTLLERTRRGVAFYL